MQKLHGNHPLLLAIIWSRDDKHTWQAFSVDEADAAGASSAAAFHRIDIRGRRWRGGAEDGAACACETAYDELNIIGESYRGAGAGAGAGEGIDSSARERFADLKSPAEKGSNPGALRFNEDDDR